LKNTAIMKALPYFELAKVRITFAVMLTTLTGYVLMRGFDEDMILPVLGIFLLACGSAALNHFQERKTDAIMDRTSLRPIPSGKVKPLNALIFSVFLSFSGAIIIYIGSGLEAMFLGILALIWYNFIYTPLKKKTPFAVIPGAVIGAIPPLVGWVAAGGSLTDPRAFVIAFFFFIWQIPHFWLLQLKYEKDYSKAGFPTLVKSYGEKHIHRLTFLWTLSTAIAAMMLPVFNVVSSEYIAGAMFMAAFWIVYVFTPLLSKDTKLINPGVYFMKINIFVLSMIIFLSIDSFL